MASVHACLLILHPGVAENIAPVGGPESDVIVEGVNTWLVLAYKGDSTRAAEGAC